jgi:hypothetical protein
MAIETVTSENREEYMEQKLAEKAGKKPKEPKKDEQLERIKNHPKYAKLVIALGKKGAMDALLKELNEKQ